MKRTLLSLLFALLLLHITACKKGDGGSTPATTANAPKELIARIMNGLTGNPGDTTVITYNADSSVHTATNVISSNSLTTYYYSSGLVREVSTVSGTVVRVDSIVLNAQGERMAAYILHPGGSQYDHTQLFTYTTSGELSQMVTFYPNMPGDVPDTLRLVWQNGDAVVQTSVSNKANYTYVYDLNKPCQAGDIQYSNYKLAIGLKRRLNAHLCTSISNAVNGTSTINYSYDSNGRIIGYTAAAAGATIGAATYDYVP